MRNYLPEIAKFVVDFSSFDHSPADSPAPNQVAGNINSWTADGKREVGYWIDRAFWGRGVATETLTAFLRLEQTRPLYASAAKHNVASLRVTLPAFRIPQSKFRNRLPPLRGRAIQRHRRFARSSDTFLSRFLASH